MPSKLLNAKFVKTARPPATGQVDYFDTKERGLVLRVGATGKRTWGFVYRMPGARRWRRYTIDKELSLKAARAHVAGLRAGVKNDGIDPAALHADAKTIDTFQDFAVEFYQKKTTAKKSKDEEARIIKNELLPRWRDRKASEVTRADVKALLQPIAERAPVMANRVLALISRMYNLAIAEDVHGITANPAMRLPKPGGEETSRDRALTRKEIRTLWTALEQAQHPPRDGDDVDKATLPPIGHMLARGLQMILVTGQRPGEVFGMKWEHVSEDGAWWDLPRTLTKNGNPHRVPLTKTAQDILKAAKDAAPKDSTYVFAGHMDASTAARAKKCAAALSNWTPLGFTFHRHDLRRTAGTGMAEEGIQTETIARVLNHVDRNPRATRTYDRFSHDPEKRTALEAWERRLLRILAEQDAADNVRPFAKRA